MPENNFEKLGRLQMENIREPSRDVKNNIDSSIGIFKFVGDLVDLFLPKLMDIILHVAGGNSKPNLKSNDTSDNLDPRYPNSF